VTARRLDGRPDRGGLNIFVDESKQSGYWMVAAILVDREVPEMRKMLQGLVMRGQRRIHMKKESDPRKRLIIDSLRRSAVVCSVYDASAFRWDLEARAACLSALVEDSRAQPSTMVMEQDDSLVLADRRVLFGACRDADARMSYRHERAATEPLLCVPDAVAWCWAKRGDWRRRIEPVVTRVRRLEP
jgi:hypothetical protein